jgi:putative flavoprotein involved in K+ transport
MDASGVLGERYDEIEDVARARRVPSLQLAGTPDRSTLDLNALTDIGVKLVGRIVGMREDGKAQFAGSLHNMCAMSDLKMGRLLDLIDTWASENGLQGIEPPHRLPPTRVEASPPLGMDLVRHGIKTIIWAAGYRPDYSWLDVPVLDRKGMIRHDGGVTDLPGLYLMGAPFLRRRKSTLIDGAADDARDLSGFLATYLDESSRHANSRITASTARLSPGLA